MKKTLKILVAIVIILTLLNGNIFALAKATMESVAEQKNQTNTIKKDSIDNENTNTQQTTQTETQNNTEQQSTSEETAKSETETVDNNEETSEEKEQLNKEQNENNKISLLNMNISNTNGITKINQESKKGKLFVEINLRLPQIKQNLKLIVKKADKVVKEFENPTDVTKEKLAGNEEGKEFYTNLYYIAEDLEIGNDYSIEILGTNYITYTQNSIEIRDNNETKIKLTNGHDSDEISSGLGVITLGNINKDGKIDATDVKQIIDEIESANPNLNYDLNGDGKVNIVDLSYVAINKDEEEIKGSIKHSLKLDTEKIEKHTTQGHIVSNSGATINDILEDNGKAVTFEPANANEAISNENPIEISLDLGQETLTETGAITIAPSTNTENNITSGIVTVETADGEILQAKIVNQNNDTNQINNSRKISKISTLKVTSRAGESRTEPQIIEAKVTKDPDGTIVIDLGKKVAVKKVTIKVTGTESNKLADISKVEFLNNMTDRIPAPSIEVPEDVKGEATAEYLTVSWKNMPNVTGYEVSIESDGVTEHYSVDGHTIKIQRFNKKDIEELHYKTFTIKVQSVNGEWRSGYSAGITLTPTPTSVPAAPDNLKLTGKFREIIATWKDMKSTKTYNVYYREYGVGEYKKVAEGLTSPSYTITGLDEEVKKYQVYVTGVNDLGESNPSLVGAVETISVKPAILPKYKLLNTPKGEGELTNHIKSVVYVSDYGKMVGSPLDEKSGIKKSALGTVDNSYASFWQKDDWDDGVSYGSYKDRGLTVEFDQAYEMNYFTMAQVENLDAVRAANITYWDEKGTAKTVSASSVQTKTDANGRNYTAIKLTDKIKASKINITISRIYGGTRNLTIAEMCFYYYDDLEEQIDNLYEGQMHVTLKKDVTEAKIKELEDRLNTKDEASGELHPEYDSLKAELDTAKQILTDSSKLKPAVEIDTTVTSKKDGNVSFSGGINAWQPLGLVGYAGEQLTIYVGNREKNVGDTASLQLIATQYDAEAAAWYSVMTSNLKIGKNTVTVPAIQSLDCEKGGSLYINYTGNNPNEAYAVRVIGGQEIPVLDLTKGKDRETEIKNYVTKLEQVVPKLEENHKKVHKGQKDSNGKVISSINYDYDEQTCILGATEIVLNEMMYSVSAKQILAGLGDGTIDEKAAKLSKSLQAMDDMMDLFYSHKGMSKTIKVGEKNSYPSGRQNIRYHRMFAGAAMYAGGLHIGIPWGDVQTLSKGNPIVTDANGKYESGNYFGWGISHEIGHIINDSHYVQAEVTNNYFSVLSQAKDTNESVRFEYPKVYEKVTSGKIGKADNVFTQLGLYWQLHLAYDHDGYNFKKYETQEQQLENLIFARIDTYARDVSKAPDEGIKLTLDSDSDNNLMRLACAATEKNVLEFFERWGFVPNEETVKYANQWAKETKAIYYMTDEARAYQLAKKTQMATGTKVEASAEYQVNYENNETNNEVKIKLGNTNKASNEGAMLGYEIVRSYWNNDQEIQRAVAFVSADDIYNGKAKDYNIEYTEDGIIYTDRIETINNRVITYKVTAYDKYLNATEQLVLDPIKVRLDGSISKGDWELESNLVEENAKFVEGDNKTTCEPEKETAISKIANNNTDDDYQAKLPEGKNGEIIISLDEEKTLVGFKYTAGKGKAIKDYEIQVSTDKETWETVKTGEFKLDNNKQQTIYFNKENDDRYYTYRASYVKLVIKNQTDISIAELDLLGKSGDNVELFNEGIGILKTQYSLGKSDVTGKDEYIPANSIIFTGEYKGNPAYNVVKLWDQNNKLIEGQQVIFAEEPKNGELGEVTDGMWIYWIEPTDDNYNTIKDSLQTVRAELYRVDNAQTNEGERLVSDTYRVKVQKPLTNIEIKSNQTK